MLPLLGRGKREESLERELIELRERYNLLEKKLEEAVEKTERVEKGARLLTEAVYKIIAYLKDLEWPREIEPPKPGVKPLVATIVETRRTREEKHLTDVEKNLVEEVTKRGMLTVSDCYELVGRSKEHVSRVLKQLVENGVLVRERKGKIFYYRRAEK